MTEHSGSRRHCTHPFKNEIFDLKTVQIQGIFASLEQVKIELRCWFQRVSSETSSSWLRRLIANHTLPFFTSAKPAVSYCLITRNRFLCIEFLVHCSCETKSLDLTWNTILPKFAGKLQDVWLRGQDCQFSFRVGPGRAKSTDMGKGSSLESDKIEQKESLGPTRLKINISINW